MDVMLQGIEVFTGQQKHFALRNAVGRNVNDAAFSLTHPSSPAIPHCRFSSRDFNDGLQGWGKGNVTELAFAFHYLV